MSMLTRRDARDPFVSMLDRFLGEPLALETPTWTRLEEGILPVDVSENDTHVTVRASLPGFKPEDIEAQVHDNVLTIKAEHKDVKEEKNERFYRKELRFGSTSRRVALPSVVKDNDIHAELKDGVLSLRMAKTLREMPRKIKIN